MVNKEQHIELVNGILESNMPLFRWCMKKQKMVHISNLVHENYSCWDCEHHVCNDGSGICDPI